MNSFSVIQVTADEAKLYDTIVFDGSPVMHQKMWPSHCIQNSWGSKLHPDLKVINNAIIFENEKNNARIFSPIIISLFTFLPKIFQVVDDPIFIHKGTNPDVDSYSAFWDNNRYSHTTLRSELQQRNISDIYVCGLAYDYCVGK